jgi:hypothetical protein
MRTFKVFDPWGQLVLLRCPSRMRREEAVNETDLVRDEKTEAKTQHTRSKCQSTGKLLATLSRHREHGGQAHRDQHHARNGAHSKDQQIRNRPMDVSNRGEDQQRYRRRTRKSVNHAHHERPKILIQSAPAKCPVHPGQRRVVGRVGMGLR